MRGVTVDTVKKFDHSIDIDRVIESFEIIGMRSDEGTSSQQKQGFMNKMKKWFSKN
jgi:hypothetical protein